MGVPIGPRSFWGPPAEKVSKGGPEGRDRDTSADILGTAHRVSPLVYPGLYRIRVVYPILDLINTKS